MKKSVRAIYENGVFRPVEPVDLAQGQAVEVLLPEEERMATHEELKARFPNSYGVMSPEEAAELKAIFEAPDFRQVDPDDWR